jgi:hypothetical protein
MTRFAILLLAGCLLPLGAVATSLPGRRCMTEAPAFTPALVELYTSEGCDSCPPADRWLARWPATLLAAEVIPLAFHVTYWDRLGWRDPFAQADFDARQDLQAVVGGKRRLYTPQVFIDGAEALDWRQEKAFDARLGAVRRRPAEARLEAQWQVLGEHLQVSISGSLWRGEAKLHLAVAESGLVSAVERGENAGKQLRHDHVVRLWRELGPLRSGRFSTEERLDLPAGLRPAQARLVAWVAADGPGGVRAALAAPLVCP